MPKMNALPRAGKMETADLEARVERLELEAREYEARGRVLEARARLDKLKAEHGAKAKKKIGPA